MKSNLFDKLLLKINYYYSKLIIINLLFIYLNYYLMLEI